MNLLAFGMSAVLAVLSLTTGNVTFLMFGLMFAIVGMITEKD